jgi:CheY-like chemotaxis protein
MDESAHTKLRGASRNLRVLVADDGELNRIVAVQQLASLGIAADTASDGAEVLRAFAQCKYDVILMDCDMPILDGYAATAEIRRREGETRRTWIIAMTAGSSEGDRQACLAAGMDDFLTKPATPDELRGALARSPAWPQQPPAIDLESMRAKGLAALLPRLIAIFLRDAPRHLADARRAAEAGDFPALASAAHAMRGACGNVGAHRMRELCASVETLSRSGVTDGTAVLLAAIEAEFHRVKTEAGESGAG